jgi:hypothetical protein
VKNEIRSIGISPLICVNRKGELEPALNWLQDLTQWGYWIMELRLQVNSSLPWTTLWNWDYKWTQACPELHYGPWPLGLLWAQACPKTMTCETKVSPARVFKSLIQQIFSKRFAPPLQNTSPEPSPQNPFHQRKEPIQRISLSDGQVSHSTPRPLQPRITRPLSGPGYKFQFIVIIY